MWTLHAYLARELGKTFVLTLVALTLLIVMGGGVANVFKARGIGAGEMATVFLFLTPVAVTIVLPVAALFSTAITYGRASADNEISACRAAGVNVQRLLLTALVLGVLVTLGTFYSWNLMLPRLSERIEALTRRDLPSIVKGEFQRKSSLAFRNYRISAERFDDVTDRPGAVEGHTYLLLTGVSFLELDQDQLARIGTADTTLIDFDGTKATPSVVVSFQDVRTIDLARGHAYEMKEQKLGPYEVPLPLKRKIKFQDLPTLRSFLIDPPLIPEISDRLFRIKRGMMDQFLFQEVHRTIGGGGDAGGTFRLVGVGGETYAISSKQPPHRSAIDNAPTLFDATVVETHPDGRRRVLDAGRLEIRTRNAPLDRARPLIVVSLSERVRRSGSDDGRVVEVASETLPAIEYVEQSGLMERVRSFAPEILLDPDYDKGQLPRKLSDAHKKLLKRSRQFHSEILGEIHFRWSYSLSAVAVVLIGAMLGIAMRGGQVLTAFGISCVPTGFVVICGIVGRNLADRAGGAPGAIAVMWGATLVTYAAAFLIGTRLLRR